MSDTQYIQFDPGLHTGSPPIYPPISGTIDSHVHLFYPDMFPYASDATYRPNAMTHEMMLVRNHTLGLGRRFLAVGATPTGDNNESILYAFQMTQGLIRSIATVKNNITDGTLNLLQQGGVEGLRYVWVDYLEREFTPPEDVIAMAKRVADRGLIFELYFEGKDFPRLKPHIEELASIVRVDIDHMGRPDVEKFVYGKNFFGFVDMLAAHSNITVKISGLERITKVGRAEAYKDATPFAKALINDFPDQVVWGSDCPHPNMLKTFDKDMPRDSNLVDMIHIVTRTLAQRKAMLIDNPMHRYWGRNVPVREGLLEEYQGRYAMEHPSP